MIQMRTKGLARNKALALGLFLLAAFVAACLLLAGTKPAHAIDLIPVFTVNSTGDEPDASAGDNLCDVDTSTPGEQCTLRAAIQEANANGTTVPDFIDFDIPGSGVQTISPATLLPIIEAPVVIDGYTQPGASENTLAVGNNAVVLIRLDGINLPGISPGLSISTTNSVVRGLSVTRFPGDGIRIFGVDNNNNTIEGNLLGMTPGGQDEGNARGLVIFGGSSHNTVGGTTRQARNIISGNGPSSQLSSAGVYIFSNGMPTTGNKVMGNYIGTTKSGSGELGNTGSGVTVNDSASGNTIGDDDPTDGLTNAANIIAFNGRQGVNIEDAASTGNRILVNSIFSNTLLGIDLDGDGRTINDTGDPDTGPNNLQNFPVLSSARTGQQATTIKGTLKSTQNGSFTIQFFSNPNSNRDEGKKFIGSRVVTDTDGDGIVPFTFKPERKVKAGLFVTATATNNFTGDTSEFSAPKKVL